MAGTKGQGMRATLFLDCDGVRVPYARRRRVVAARRPGLRRGLVQGRRFDPACLALLLELVQGQGLDVVLVSSWRYRLEAGTLLDHVASIGLSCDAVELKKRSDESRLLEVLDHVREHELERWIVIDDDPRRELRSLDLRLIVPNRHEGLTASDARDAREELERQASSLPKTPDGDRIVCAR